MNEHSSTTSLEAVHSLSVAIATAADAGKIYDLILDVVVKTLGVERASIMRYDPAIGALRIVAARGMSPEIAKNALVKVGEGISGKVFVSNEPLLSFKEPSRNQVVAYASINRKE